MLDAGEGGGQERGHLRQGRGLRICQADGRTEQRQMQQREEYDAAQMRYTYRAKNGGALPVTNYTSTIRVTADGAKSVVEWRGAFYRGFPNNDPPPDQNDEAAVRAVTQVYRSGLANLKKLVEGQ